MIIYINNFKGFENTYIQLRDVNFFIGENNTGKTVVIKMINTLIAENFFFSHKTNTPINDFGRFSDIISVDIENNECIQFGYFSEKINEQEKGEIGAFMLNLTVENDMPKIHSYRLIANNYNIEVEISPKLRYKFSKYKPPESLSTETNRQNFFENWINSADLDDMDFINVMQYSFMRHDTIYATKYVVFKEINKQSKDKNFIPYRNKISDVELQWIASQRVRAKNVYRKSEIAHSNYGEDMPMLIFNLLNSEDETSESLVKTLNEFGKESGLFHQIEVKELSDDQKAQFEITVIINNSKFKLINSGYGVSQVLPVLAEMLTSKNDKWLAIQQPEIYMHPRARKAFGRFIFKINQIRKLNFIIETHSPLIINEFVKTMNKFALNQHVAQIYSFTKQHNTNTIIQLEIPDDTQLLNQLFS